MIWDSTKQDHKMFQFVQKLIAFRKENAQLLSKGEIQWRKVDDVHKIVEIERRIDKQKVKAIFNFGQDKITVDEDVLPAIEQNFENGNLQPQGLVIYKD